MPVSGAFLRRETTALARVTHHHSPLLQKSTQLILELILRPLATGIAALRPGFLAAIEQLAEISELAFLQLLLETLLESFATGFLERLLAHAADHLAEFHFVFQRIEGP